MRALTLPCLPADPSLKMRTNKQFPGLSACSRKSLMKKASVNLQKNNIKDKNQELTVIIAQTPPRCNKKYWPFTLWTSKWCHPYPGLQLAILISVLTSEVSL